MTKSEAKIKALEYIIKCNYAFAELSEEFDLYTDSQYDKIQNQITEEIEILERKLDKLKQHYQIR